jgi:PAS domain S-box-containing protein
MLLVLFFVLIFFVLLSAYRARLSSEIEEERDLQVRQRIELSALLAAKSLGNEPAPFGFLKDQADIKRVTLWDRSGRVLGDSNGRAKTGSLDPDLGLSSEQLERVLSGEFLRLPWFREASGKPAEAFFAPVRRADGPAVVRVLTERANEKHAADFKVFLWIYGLISFGVLGYYGIRMVRRERGEGVSGGELMVNAFHGLISRLKSKEEELQRLRLFAEERAKEAENYSENVLESVTSGVITLDRGMRIATVNAAAESILKLDKEEVLAKPGEAIFGKESRILHLLRQAISEQAVISRQELEIERRGGERIWVGISFSLLRDRRGAVIGTTLVFTDLTEIKRLQEQVEIKKRLLVLGEMSAWIAHEFRNYMGTILGLARLLSKQLEETGQQAMVQSIMDELAAMDRLISELLSYGKRTEMHPQSVDLKELIEDLTESFRTAGRLDGIDLDVRIPSALPPAALDPTLIRQALTNLIQNALEALDESAISEREGKALRIEAWQRPSEIVLEISDSGGGIPNENLDKIFLPFFTTKQKGTGLGLALVHKIVLSHNGRIEARNLEEGGASFTVTLPVYTSRETWKPSSSSKIAKV